MMVLIMTDLTASNGLSRTGLCWYTACSYNPVKVVPFFSSVRVTVWFELICAIGLGSLFISATPFHVRCPQAPLSAEINLATMAFVIWGSYKPLIKASWIKTPLGFLGPNVYWCGVIGWLLAVLTDQPWLYLHGAGFSASLFQGVSHRWSGEAANLPELALRSEVEGAGDEIGHVSYFPVLIFHASFQTLGWCTPRAHPALELGQGAVPGLASI